MQQNTEFGSMSCGLVVTVASGRQYNLTDLVQSHKSCWVSHSAFRAVFRNWLSESISLHRKNPAVAMHRKSIGFNRAVLKIVGDMFYNNF